MQQCSPTRSFILYVKLVPFMDSNANLLELNTTYYQKRSKNRNHISDVSPKTGRQHIYESVTSLFCLVPVLSSALFPDAAGSPSQGKSSMNHTLHYKTADGQIFRQAGEHGGPLSNWRPRYFSCWWRWKQRLQKSKSRKSVCRVVGMQLQ